MEGLNDFLAKELYHNSLSNWVISLLLIFGAVIIARILYWLLNKVAHSVTSKTETELDDMLLSASKEPVVFIVAILASWYGLARLSFTAEIDVLIGNVYYFIVTVGITWLIVRVLDAFIEKYLVPLTLSTESDFDDQLLPIVQKGVKTIIWSLGIIVALNNAGYNVSAIIAGMGIGGLAFALAAKDTLANIFGGVTIFTDKPFRLNDRIKMNGFDGTIVEIGMRSTRLKTLEGRIVTIPNSKFTDGMVENVTLEPTRKVVMKLGLIYDTTPEKMELAMKILKEIDAENTDTNENGAVAFTEFGDFSLGILYIYYIKKGADILGVQSKMNLRILNEFALNGLEMAFPTQTIYTKKE